MRECGVLLPIASLPSKYGIGAFSKEAYEFVDQLKAAGQSYWQILPLGPTGYGDSPYQAFSAFAGNPYFIDLEQLIEGELDKPIYLQSGLKLLTSLLYKHYEVPVIVLIDEYDVPLDKAYQRGYYSEMVQLIRLLFSRLLKTNANMHFAVITGCLLIMRTPS